MPALAAKLLAVSTTVADLACAPPGSDAARLGRLLGESGPGRGLPPEERGCSLSVALAALAGVLDPNAAAINADGLKQGLRRAGALDAALAVAVGLGSALTERSPTLDTVRSLWRLHRCLALVGECWKGGGVGGRGELQTTQLAAVPLATTQSCREHNPSHLPAENACFACPANEAHVAAARITRGVPPLTTSVPAMAWLVGAVADLGAAGLGSSGLKKDCLRAALAVLMNCTQDNPAGCEAVVAAGGLEAVAPVVAQIVEGGPKLRGATHSRDDLTAWVDELRWVEV